MCVCAYINYYGVTMDVGVVKVGEQTVSFGKNETRGDRATRIDGSRAHRSE